MPIKLVQWGPVIIAIVGVLIAVGASIAVTDERLDETEEDVQDHEFRLRAVEQTLSAMNADIRWIVVTLDDIRNRLYQRNGWSKDD